MMESSLRSGMLYRVSVAPGAVPNDICVSSEASEPSAVFGSNVPLPPSTGRIVTVGTGRLENFE